jgi:LIVCS family branched-chain amino acid:cation transporter
MPAWMLYGFAVFSMFFGSGNLVFPMSIGVGCANPWISILGLSFSAILVPMFGLIGVVLSRESLEHYLKPLGQKTAFALIAMMLLLLGPLGVLPRSLIVASGGVSLLFAQIPTSLIALMMVFLGYFLALSKNMVRLIGQYFTPLILLGILGIVLGALFLPLQINHAQQGSFWDALKTGYQTMDLIAALVFARALSSAFLKQFPKSARVEMMGAIVFGFFCLLCVYAFMVLVSSHLSDQLQFVAPEKRIVFIADLVMGDYARIISCFVIAAACMTTFAVLLREFIQFFAPFFPNWSLSQLAFVVCVLSYMGSFIGFDQLASAIGLILQLAYPALIVFILLKFLRLKQHWIYAWVFYGCIFFNVGLELVKLN